LVRNRLLESWWAGRTAWLFRRASWRHRDLHARLRMAALDVGAELVAARHGAAPERLAEAVERLEWLVRVAEACGALDPGDELGTAVLTTVLGIVDQ
jgi:hypothetical protein